MKRKLRLSSETLKVLSREQARGVVGGTEDQCQNTYDCTQINNPCVGPTSTDYTWFQCNGCEATCDANTECCGPTGQNGMSVCLCTNPTECYGNCN